MTIVPSARGDTQLCTKKDRNYIAVACYIVISSRIPGLLLHLLQPQLAGYSNSSDLNSQPEKMDDREDIIKPDNDPPNYQPGVNRVDDSNWLRLRLGCDDQSSINLQSYPAHHQSTRSDRCRRLELDLLSIKQQQVVVSNTWPPPTSAANPSINLMELGQMAGFNGTSDGGGASSSSSGIWFMLQASQNQVVEPFLPQIPKSYLRIKDGRMTVRLLKKYIGRKLGLESESEQVEIICRGQELQPNLTLQHVRDNVWCSRRDASLLTLLTVSPSSSSSSSTTLLPSVIASESHIMILHYARAAATTITTST